MKNSMKILSVLFAVVMLFSSFVFPTSARSLADIEAEIAANEKKLEELAKQIGTDVPANASDYQAYAHDLVINQYGWA